MVHDPISVLDALMIALSGIVIVFLMLALLWGVIAVISRVMGGSAGQAGRRQRGGGGLRYGYRQPRNGHSARSACI